MFHITATNPHGLDYNYLIDEPLKAATILRNIFEMGGEDIRVNGNLVTV